MHGILWHECDVNKIIRVYIFKVHEKQKISTSFIFFESFPQALWAFCAKSLSSLHLVFLSKLIVRAERANNNEWMQRKLKSFIEKWNEGKFMWFHNIIFWYWMILQNHIIDFRIKKMLRNFNNFYIKLSRILFFRTITSIIQFSSHWFVEFPIVIIHSVTPTPRGKILNTKPINKV